MLTSTNIHDFILIIFLPWHIPGQVDIALSDDIAKELVDEPDVIDLCLDEKEVK